MSDILLIRHGQANTGATDEASYDRLSPLGHQQAAWLGAHLRDTGQHYDRVLTGTLRRHHETATAMDMGLPTEADARLNELDYFSMAWEMERRHELPFPTSPQAFAAHVAPTMEAWQAGELTDAPESFAAFESRVRGAITDMAAAPERMLVVTSGGVIAMAMRFLLDLGLVPMSRMLLATKNTSVHALSRRDGRLMLMQFGAVPHLEHTDRAEAHSST